MVDETFIAYFRLAHGFFNLSLFCLFCYQGWVGIKIRKARLAEGPMPVDLVRRHRRMGPVFALWGVLGFVAGTIMILLDKGRILEYPLHFVTGLLVVLVILSLYAISRRIQTASAPYRDIHFGLGMLLLLLYVIQSFLGVSILL